ncbi:MAG: hypothetical protein SV966_10910 [Actinomycetota bacterium]|nr:hypothetical protein [Actinomycetota bacterium]
MNNDHDDPAAGWDDIWPADEWAEDWADDDHTYTTAHAVDLISKVMWAAYAKRIRAELDNDLRTTTKGENP